MKPGKRYVWSLSIAAVLTFVATLASAKDDISGSLVYIVAKGQNALGHPSETNATGFFVGSEGNILTSYHLLTKLGDVIPRKTKIEVHIGSKEGPLIRDVDIVDFNEARDILVLDVNQKDMGKPLCVDPAYIPEKGEELSSFGFPETLKDARIDGNLVTIEGNSSFWIVSIIFNEGQSGSPVINSSGNVIGVAKGQNAVAKQDRLIPVPGQYVVVPIADSPRLASFGRAGCHEDAADNNKFFSAVYLGAPKEAIVSVLGSPKTELTFTSPSEDLLRMWIEDVEYEFTPADWRSLSRLVSGVEVKRSAYVFDEFISEILYVDDRVVQYSVLVTSGNVLSLSDSHFKDMPVDLGGNYFSQICDNAILFGFYYNHDNLVQLRCPSNEAHDNVAMAVFWSPIGKTFGDFGDLNFNGPEENVLDSYFPIGYFALTGHMQSYDPMPYCDEDLSPITSRTALLEAVGKLPESSKRSASHLPVWPESLVDIEKICLSLRIVRPNGAIITDDNFYFGSVKLGNGEDLLITPSLFSSGMMTRLEYGADRAALGGSGD